MEYNVKIASAYDGENLDEFAAALVAGENEDVKKVRLDHEGLNNTIRARVCAESMDLAVFVLSAFIKTAHEGMGIKQWPRQWLRIEVKERPWKMKH